MHNNGKCALHFHFNDGNKKLFAAFIRDLDDARGYEVLSIAYRENGADVIPLGSWMRNAYTYDFRVYSILEVQEAMLEAGFRQTHVWWAETKGETTHEKSKRSTSQSSRYGGDDGVDTDADAGAESGPQEPHIEDHRTASPQWEDLDENDGVYMYEKIEKGAKLEGVYAWNGQSWFSFQPLSSWSQNNPSFCLVLAYIVGSLE
jgi:hypothetical protein